LEQETARPDFWQDPAEARKTLARLTQARDIVQGFGELQSGLEDTQVLFDLAIEEGDESHEPEIRAQLEDLKRRAEDMELEALFVGEFDEHNAIVTVHAGAGGTESQDWAEMLLRMYLRWAETRGLKSELFEVSPGEEAGIKSATFTVRGRHAYGLLQGEKGVHRLVRMSPFDASKRRHTSFASVDVIPEIEEDIQIDIDAKDLRVETYRAQGAGGQHVNKTDSAVRITHISTGTVAQCQNERSQLQNRETAMRILKARLFEREREQREAEMRAIRGEQKEIAWGSQIRSYVFQPYTMVKDHRTKTEVGNVQGVMDGAIDPFISAYLKERRQTAVPA